MKLGAPDEGAPSQILVAEEEAPVAEEEAPSPGYEEQPALPPLYVPVAAEEKPIMSQEGNNSEAIISEAAQSGDEAQWGELVLEQFAALHATTVRTDGYGDTESAAVTRERFERLHQRVEVEQAG